MEEARSKLRLTLAVAGLTKGPATSDGRGIRCPSGRCIQTTAEMVSMKLPCLSAFAETEIE